MQQRWVTTGVLTLLLLAGFGPIIVHADDAAPVWQREPVTIKHSRAELEQRWQKRIQSFLGRGVVPLIDLESTLLERDANNYLTAAIRKMDALGIALIAFDGKGKKGGSQWGDYMNQLVNAYPDHFIPTTNGGTTKDWLEQGDSYISLLEAQVKTGQYAIMGELDFRHYMSAGQCRDGRTDRDNNIPLTSLNGHRVFRLSADTGVAFVIHLDPEDQPLADLETMLAQYPKARVIVAHFGQIRFPERQKRFTPELVRRLLTKFPNLYYDLSTGHPGRRYECNKGVLDTVLWQDAAGSQLDKLTPAYQALLAEFSTRFVAGTDYGGGRKPLPDFLPERVENLRRIMSQLPVEAQHNIGYRNAWSLLTSQSWPGGAPGL